MVRAAAFAFGPRDGYASAAAEGNDIFGRFEGVGMTEELVQFRSLDSLIEQPAVPEPDVVKLDVEGLEAEALLGMRHLLTRSHPTLAIEAHSVRLLADTLAVLDDVGYTNVVIVRERSTGPWHVLTGPEWASKSHVHERADSPVSRRTAGAVL